MRKNFWWAPMSFLLTSVLVGGGGVLLVGPMVAGSASKLLVGMASGVVGVLVGNLVAEIVYDIHIRDD